MEENSIIISIGDSHSQIFDSGDNFPVYGRWIDQNLNNKFMVNWLGPVTLNRLVREGFESFDVFTKIKENQKCILSFGEIDSRQHINYQSNKQNIPYDKIIDNLIDGFKKRLIEFNYQNYKFCILGLVPAVKKIDAGEPDTLLEDHLRKEYTDYFNKKYKELCNDLGILYLDQYSIFSSEDGYIDKNSFDGLIHGIKLLSLKII